MKHFKKHFLKYIAIIFIFIFVVYYLVVRFFYPNIATSGQFGDMFGGKKAENYKMMLEQKVQLYLDTYLRLDFLDLLRGLQLN
mgnify:CR=1 FL=1